MQSDSASVLASRVLNWVYPNNIVSISVADSIEASDHGFANCSGVVNIATTFREPLFVIINGIPNKTKEKISAGEILGDHNYIKHFVQNEFSDIAHYGIKDFVILKENKLEFFLLRTPWVVVTTELPYYQTDNLVGKYTGKRGRQSYELKLSADSNFVFSKNIIHKKAIVQEIHNNGTWGISEGDVFLLSRQDSTIPLQGCPVLLDTICLKINSTRSLTLPKGTWNNKKSVTLKR